MSWHCCCLWGDHEPLLSPPPPPPPSPSSNAMDGLCLWVFASPTFGGKASVVSRRNIHPLPPYLSSHNINLSRHIFFIPHLASRQKQPYNTTTTCTVTGRRSSVAAVTTEPNIIRLSLSSTMGNPLHCVQAWSVRTYEGSFINWSWSSGKQRLGAMMFVLSRRRKAGSIVVPNVQSGRRVRIKNEYDSDEVTLEKIDGILFATTGDYGSLEE